MKLPPRIIYTEINEVKKNQFQYHYLELIRKINKLFDPMKLEWSKHVQLQLAYQ